MKIERFKAELQRTKEDASFRGAGDSTTLAEQARLLEEKASKHEIESLALEHLLEKYKEAIINEEIIEILNEIKMFQLQLGRLQQERALLRAEVEVREGRINTLNSSPVKRKTDSPARFREVAVIRRRLEEVKDTISTIESNADIYTTKKTALEKELNRLVSSEKARFANYHELEKENHYVI